jgi:protein required for attachment to host cells
MTPMTARTWILVSDGCRGRVFQNEGPGTAIRPVRHHHIYGRDDAAPAINGENGHGRGRAFDPANLAPRLSSFGAADEPGVNTAFTRTLSRFLDRSMEEEAFDRLVIVAPPQALGAVCGALSSTVRARVAREVSRNLMNCSAVELPKYLGPGVAARNEKREG